MLHRPRQLHHVCLPRGHVLCRQILHQSRWFPQLHPQEIQSGLQHHLCFLQPAVADRLLDLSEQYRDAWFLSSSIHSSLYCLDLGRIYCDALLIQVMKESSDGQVEYASKSSSRGELFGARSDIIKKKDVQCTNITLLVIMLIFNLLFDN